MLLVKNIARAKVVGILPGREGTVDEQNPSVKSALKAGILVDVEAERARLITEAGGDADLATALAAVRTENTALRARVAELEAQLAAADALAKATASAAEKPSGGSGEKPGRRG